MWVSLLLVLPFPRLCDGESGQVIPKGPLSPGFWVCLAQKPFQPGYAPSRGPEKTVREGIGPTSNTWQETHAGCLSPRYDTWVCGQSLNSFSKGTFLEKCLLATSSTNNLQGPLQKCKGFPWLPSSKPQVGTAYQPRYQCETQRADGGATVRIQRKNRMKYQPRPGCSVCSMHGPPSPPPLHRYYCNHSPGLGAASKADKSWDSLAFRLATTAETAASAF